MAFEWSTFEAETAEAIIVDRWIAWGRFDVFNCIELVENGVPVAVFVSVVAA